MLGDPAGEAYLQETIADYLHQARGVLLPNLARSSLELEQTIF